MGLDIRYAKSGDVSIAYAVVGDGPMDLVLVPGYVGHIEVGWENPLLRRFVERLARFARVVVFDRRGTGLSDPIDNVSTMEERLDDLRAVMDAVGSERAAFLGMSEGATMSVMFATTYPERTTALVLYGGLARATYAPDHPWATPREALLEAVVEFWLPTFGNGEVLETFAPTLADDTAMRTWQARAERMSASPGMLQKVYMQFLDTDIRHILPLVDVPTLVLHRSGDRVVSVRAGRWMAEQIKGARFVELPGPDHYIWAGDTERLVDEIEEFLTGTRATSVDELDRVLATVMFTDVVGSTERAAALGDTRWRDLLEGYYAVVRRELEHFRGREIKTIGDGVLATFDGPIRAIRAAEAIRSGSRQLGLELRIGLHTGECELRGDDVGGIAVNTSARIVKIAEPGEVLVSSTVKELVTGSTIQFDDRGVRELKGVPGEWRLFALSG